MHVQASDSTIMTMAKLLDADWLRGVQFGSCTAVQLMISKQTGYITAV